MASATPSIFPKVYTHTHVDSLFLLLKRRRVRHFGELRFPLCPLISATHGRRRRSVEDGRTRKPESSNKNKERAFLGRRSEGRDSCFVSLIRGDKHARKSCLRSFFPLPLLLLGEQTFTLLLLFCGVMGRKRNGGGEDVCFDN